ncbi:MAG: energy transducer TonB [Candidatus Krumholzibacteriia bacterium]
MRFLPAALASLVITGLILVAAAQLVRERPQRQDITEPVPVALVNVPRDEAPPEEPERKPPEPPRQPPEVDFAPELPTPSLTAPQLAGPAVTLNPSLFTAPTASGPPVFEVGELDRPPRAIARREPVYPYRARQRRIEGRVRVRFLVGADGRTSEITVLEAEPAGVFDQAVLDAVASWRFEPGVLAGRPVAAWMVTPIVFDLGGDR